MAVDIVYKIDDGVRWGERQPATIARVHDGENYGEMVGFFDVFIEADDSRTCGFALTLVEIQRTSPRAFGAVWPIDAKSDQFESFVAYCEADSIAADIRDLLAEAGHGRRAA